MDILFLKDLLPTARAGDVKNVKPGFARNYLIPQGVAVLATEEALQRATKLRAEAEERKVQETKDWKVVADSLEDTELDIEVRTGPTGRLYGSITPAIIADSLAEKLGKEMNKRFFNILEPIRVLGKYKIFVKFVEEVNFNLTLNVVPDEESQKVIEEHKEEQEKLKKLEEKEQKSEANSEEELNKEENDQKTSSEINEIEDNNSNN
ncbi:MAG: 50S ribosomal protein L9 [SAR202 cluster bacterium]|nr:50S ribosomal protein L9 [SAR202 cluster bacterium]OUU76612.1 MAG: 50S ribosomal protein L9 [Chloroflexi bacterium TMED70]RZP16821.1 MAG: 50S ribosomal protein L9 [Chloroflexota bacterium]|tara:strand:+ start:29529 stop:30149 length:621 start_codon:yes stop_codon:yes gene_type:complete